MRKFVVVYVQCGAFSLLWFANSSVKWFNFLMRNNFMSSFLHTGLDAELYYVRDNVVNHYALSFTLPVPSETNSLHFTWHSKTKVSRSIWNYHLITIYFCLCTLALRFILLYLGWLPAWLPHGKSCCHEQTKQQHLHSGGGAPSSLWFVKYLPFAGIYSCVHH